MEEADLLCDKIAIMADGSLAAYGTSMDLKRRFGVGYRMTIVKQRSGSETTSPARQGFVSPGRNSRDFSAQKAQCLQRFPVDDSQSKKEKTSMHSVLRAKSVIRHHECRNSEFSKNSPLQVTKVEQP